jgi:hypothetical protein
MRSKSHFAFNISYLSSVHYSDEISNRQFIIDFAKVAEFMNYRKQKETIYI